MTILPQDFARRSFLYRELESAGATFDEVNGAAIAMAFGDDAAAEPALPAKGFTLSLNRRDPE